jgi:hypothetical protein
MPTAQKPRSPPARRPRRAQPKLELPVRKTEPKIQLNTRVSDANYQQLKLAAVLQRVPVQTLVEHAIGEFLSKHPELMRTAATASRSHPNATTRKPR